MILMLPLAPLHAVTAAAVQSQCFETAWEASAMAAVLAMPGTFGWFALIYPELGRVGDSVQRIALPVGLIVCRCLLDEAEILTMGVVPQARRLGLGRRLVEHVQAVGTAMFLEVAIDNTAALALYLALGFRQVGRRPGYYRRAGGTAIDALILQT